MSPSALLLFAAVYAAAVATPGPGIAALVARVLGQGLPGIAPFIAGFVVGDMVWLILAALGLSVLAHGFAGVFLAVKYAGVAYLLGLAYRMFTGPVGGELAAPPASRGWRAFLGALSLTLGNPKVMIFFLSIMPLLIDLKALTPVALLELAALCAVLLSAILTAYALAADRTRSFLRSTRAMRLAHRAAGGVMVGAAAMIATR